METNNQKTGGTLTPYYNDGRGILIYHGDCRDILPTLPKVDLVLTDPPYGIAKKWVGGLGRGWGKSDNEKTKRNKWDVMPNSSLIDLVVQMGEVSIVWGGNYFQLPPARGWLVWNKPERGFTLAEAELAWTNIDMVTRVCDCHRSDSGRQHPTQKPIYLMRWCLSFTPKAVTVLYPFMGSGTTLVAAKESGRKCIGVEIDEAYCELAAKRLQQEQLFGCEVAQGPVAHMVPGQLPLGGGVELGTDQSGLCEDGATPGA